MIIHRETLRVRTYECGPERTVYPHDLMRQMQEAASNHADTLGWGFADLDAQDLFWVLSVIRVEITHWPRFGSEYILSTWPSGLNRLQATREFLGTDQHGQALFAASSIWMILNRKTDRPQNLLQLEQPFPIEKKRAISQKIRRNKPKDIAETVMKIQVPASALDINGHVNNTEYLRWAYDALCRQQVQPGFSSFQLSFHAEVFAGDEIEFGIIEGTRSLEVSGFRSADGKPMITAFFEM